MKIITVISSVFFFLIVSCSSVRTFDLVASSGGMLKGDSIVIEDSQVQIIVKAEDTDYDLLAFNFTIKNKSRKYINLNIKKIYLKNSLTGVHYPLPIDEVYSVIQSHTTFEDTRERMLMRRRIAVSILKSGEIPPFNMVKGTLYFEPGLSDVKEVSLVIRGIEMDGTVLDFQDLVFQDEDHAEHLRKLKARKEAQKRKEEARKKAEAERRLKEEQKTKKEATKPTAPQEVKKEQKGTAPANQ